MKEIKKNYDRAEIEVIRFESRDIITGSGDESSGEGGIYDNSWDVN